MMELMQIMGQIPPPAIGYDFFQGPIVPSSGDTAIAFGEYISNYKNIPMTSFVKYIGAAVGWEDPNDVWDVYNLMQGYHNNGDPFINSETGEITKFVYADDPNDNTGLDDGVWVDSDDHPSGDRRFMMSSGPFTMAPGDSQEVIFAVIIARGTDELNSITELKKADVTAQRAFDRNFKSDLPSIMDQVSATSYRESILLNWETNADEAESFTAEALFGEDSTGNYAMYTFQGYNVYQLETVYGAGEIERIATYDIVDGVTEIWDDVYDETYGNYVYVRTQYGSDIGLQHHLMIDTDVLKNDTSLLPNREYYYAVTAYAYSEFAQPKAIESEIEIISVRPGISTQFEENKDFSHFFYADHISGSSDGSVSVVVIDPHEITGHDYEVRFRQNDSSLVVWDLFNITDNRQLIDGETIQGGIDQETGDNVGLDANPIVEGLQIQVTGAPDDLKWVGVTANASGELASPVDALAYWYFPKYLIADGDYTDQQTTTEATWFFNVGPQYGVDQDALLGSVFPYTGGYAVPGSGIGYVIPDDFEVRFTGAGKAINYWADESIVDVPFEWWNIGVASDPSDDYQLIPYFLDEDDNGEWNLQFGSEDADHGTSGAFNDPWTDRVYVLSPTDDTPGTQGYDNFMAAAPNNYGGLPAWYSGAGWTDPGGPLDAWNTFSRTTFMIWNGGDVTTATSPADYSAESPEIGTIFRIATTNPLNNNDVYFFSTDSLKPSDLDYSVNMIKIWPNPYFAYNPEERSPLERKVMFTHLPETATIRIFDLAGNLVRIIKHSDRTQYETWDLTNFAGRRVSSGMYIIHFETDVGDAILKLAVIQPRD